MDLDLTFDQELLAETTERFLNREYPTDVVRRMATTAEGFDWDYWRRGAELGWTSLLVAEREDGTGAGESGIVDLSVIAELFGRHVAAGPLVPVNCAAYILAKSEGAKDYEPEISGIMNGGHLAVWCDGASASHCGTVNIVRDNAHYLLFGTVSPVESLMHADTVLVTGDSERGPLTLSVPTALAGVRLEKLIPLDLVRRFGSITFDGCRVPFGAAVQSTGDSAVLLRRVRQISTLLAAAESCGAANRAFEMALAWSSDRYSFGRPLSSYQEIKHRFADMRTWLECCFATTAAAARGIAERRTNAAELISVAKAYVSERACEVIQDCVQIHGGIGVTWDHDLHLYLRRATTNWALGGTPTEHRESLASEIYSR